MYDWYVKSKEYRKALMLRLEMVLDNTADDARLHSRCVVTDCNNKLQTSYDFAQYYMVSKLPFRFPITSNLFLW